MTLFEQRALWSENEGRMVNVGRGDLNYVKRSKNEPITVGNPVQCDLVTRNELQSADINLRTAEVVIQTYRGEPFS